MRDALIRRIFQLMRHAASRAVRAHRNLNKWTQSHEVPNLFVTDGAAFNSQACVNPSITFMAMTARAVDYAAKQMEAGRI